MKKQKKNGKDALIKINRELYHLVKEFLKAHHLEYPSIKNFVETAIKKGIGFKKYNIEGVDADSRLKEPLEKVVGGKIGEYTHCLVCKGVFLKKRRSIGKICNRCKAIISHLAKELNKKEFEFKRKS